MARETPISRVWSRAVATISALRNIRSSRSRSSGGRRSASVEAIRTWRNSSADNSGSIAYRIDISSPYHRLTCCPPEHRERQDKGKSETLVRFQCLTEPKFLVPRPLIPSQILIFRPRRRGSESYYARLA